MLVTFAGTSKTQNRIGPIPVGDQKIVFNRGTFSTTDKVVIKGLLASTPYKRGRFKMVNDQKMVADYLSNDKEPDYISDDYMDSIPDEAVLKIGKYLNAKNEFPALVRAELVGLPIDDVVADIVKEYIDESSTDEPEQKKESTSTSTKSKTNKKAPAKKK